MKISSENHTINCNTEYKVIFFYTAKKLFVTINDLVIGYNNTDIPERFKLAAYHTMI